MVKGTNNNMTQWIPLFVAIVIAVGGLGSGFWAQRKNKADAAQILVQTALSLVAQKDLELKDCNEENVRREAELEILRAGIKKAEERAISAETRVDDLLERITKNETELNRLRITIETLTSKSKRR
jgi:peptidoglycan hydrolase CwlO-like protein